MTPLDPLRHHRRVLRAMLEVAATVVVGTVTWLAPARGRPRQRSPRTHRSRAPDPPGLAAGLERLRHARLVRLVKQWGRGRGRQPRPRPPAGPERPATLVDDEERCRWTRS